MTTSVALCTYKGELFLKEQLNSILSQTVPVDEVVICDDGSWDNTVAIINKYVEHFPFIRLIHNEANLGGKKNFEKAVSLCTSDVIFLCDQDDIWIDNKVDKTLQYFKQHQNIQGVFHNAFLYDGKAIDERKTLWDALNFSVVKHKVSATGIFRAQIFYRNFVTGACLAIRREALINLLPFQLLNNMWHDEWIALKLSLNQQLGWMDEPLLQYRKHNTQQTKLPAELDNEDLNNVRKAIFSGDSNKYPLYTYFHFSRRIEFANIVKTAINFDDSIISEMEALKRQGLLAYFAQFKPARRKMELMKWMVKGKLDVTLKDLVTI